MKVGLDQPRHDRPSRGIDTGKVTRQIKTFSMTGVSDLPISDQDGPVGDHLTSGPVKKRTVFNQQLTCSKFHDITPNSKVKD
jgi:hypothetical protein